ncbi:MAG TPA: glycosyltransferase family 1 protein [Aquihabitans sp.]|nr:glycosyltransferase family 1 protein [Aquihabitans sp.]
MDAAIRVAVTVEQSWHRVPGGTATSILSTLGALAGQPDLELVGVAARHADAPPVDLVPPIPVQHLPLPRLALYESWHALGWPKVERATGPVDVVHATAVAIPPTDAPLVVTVHDLAFLADPTQPTRHGLRFFRRGTELARRRARLILVPSEATAAECRDAGFDPARIRLVPWGVDRRAVGRTEVEAVRRTHGLERPYVLFVGTFEPRKNLGGLLQGARALAGRDVELVLVGPDGWNEDAGPKIDALERAGVTVRRLGWVAPSDLPALYAGAAAFCFPSRREGFGMPVLEAMAQGAPVVTSAGTATEEAAGGAALLVDPLDPDAIGEALAAILDDGALAADLARRGRLRAAEASWARTAELTAAAYREAAA